MGRKKNESSYVSIRDVEALRKTGRMLRRMLPKNNEERDKRDLFRVSFRHYKFASVGSLIDFEGELLLSYYDDDYTPEAFSEFWRGYAKDKGWDEHEVEKFIQAFIESRGEVH